MTHLLLDLDAPQRRPPLVLAAPPTIEYGERGEWIDGAPTARLVLEPYGVLLLTPHDLDCLVAQALEVRAHLARTGVAEEEP